MTEETKPHEETVETLEEETVEEVRDPVAILKKNKQLLSDLKASKERAGQLEELGRTLGDDAVADPRAFLAKRAEDTKAAEHRARLVREAVLTKIVNEQRTVKGTAEELVQKVLADPGVKVDGDKILGLDAALQSAPKKAAPVPWSPPVRYGTTAPKTLEELQVKGPDAVKAFAEKSPEVYQTLRDDWQKRLATPGRRG